LPKLLSFLLILKRGEASLYGGLVCLGVSIALEIVLSTLLAPIRMWFHSKFVLLTLIGRQIAWKTQSRTSNTTGWQEAISAHGSSALFASAWIASLSGINPAVLLWLAPVTTSLILSIPLSVYLSRPSLGQAAKRWRLFQIPEETFAPPVVAAAQSIFARRRVRDFPGGGFVYTVMDLPANRLHGEVLRWRTPKSPRDIERNKVLHESALNDGLAVLSSSQKAHLLINDADSMYALHGEIYQRGDPPVTVHRCVDSFEKLEGFIDSLRHKQGEDRSLPVFRRLQSSKHDLASLQENANVKADECSKS
jgi:membrane glycosyltransferase